MDLTSIGKNIRKYRLNSGLRQEDIAEQTNLSVKYIGMIERGEKTPSLETLIRLLNVLDVSADAILADVINSGYQLKTSQINEKLEKLSSADRAMIFDVLNVLIQHSDSNTIK